MKKNVMMRLASFLLVAVLISTSAISGTYAKYVTADEGTDTARVAKWGVEIEAESFGMFDTNYATDDDNATFEGTYSVSSSDTTYLHIGYMPQKYAFYEQLTVEEYFEVFLALYKVNGRYRSRG